MSQPVKTHGLSHIALAVADLDRTLAFYRSVFGVKEYFRNLRPGCRSRSCAIRTATKSKSGSSSASPPAPRDRRSVPIPRLRLGDVGVLTSPASGADAKPQAHRMVGPDVQTHGAQQPRDPRVVLAQHDQNNEQRGAENRNDQRFHGPEYRLATSAKMCRCSRMAKMAFSTASNLERVTGTS